MFGGYRKDKSLRSYSFATRQWTQLPDLPTARKAHRSVAVGKEIFLISCKDNATIERYDVESGRVSKTYHLETYRYSFGACLYDGDKIMVAGGQPEGLWSSDTTFLFDTVKGTVEEAARMTCDRKAFAVVNCRGAVYAIGGSSASVSTIEHGIKYNSGSLKSIERYDPKSGGWVLAPFELVVGRRHHCAVAHDRFIYVFGGETGNVRHFFFDTVERIDTRTDRVEVLSCKMRRPRSRVRAVKVSERRVCLLGGVIGEMVVSDAVEWFDLDKEEMSSGGEDVVLTGEMCTSFTACVL